MPGRGSAPGPTLDYLIFLRIPTSPRGEGGHRYVVYYCVGPLITQRLNTRGALSSIAATNRP